MTNKINFTHEEKRILLVVLDLRIEFLQAANDLYPRHGQSIRSESLKEAIILSKMLRDHELLVLNAKQKSFLCGCINENLDSFRKGFHLKKKNLGEWASLSDEQVKDLKLDDTCQNILAKCDFFKCKNHRLYNIDQTYRYHHTLTAIEKLKNSQTIILSKIR